jgi:hypothetical protein
MKLLKGWKLRLLAGMAAAITGEQLNAQMMPGPSANPVAHVNYQGDEGMAPPMMTPGMDMGAYGPGPECGPGCGPMDGSMGGEGCYTCGDGRAGLLGGCGLRGRLAADRFDLFGRSLTGFRRNLFAGLGSMRGKLRPYGEGGISAQRWFDVSADVIGLSQTRGVRENFVLSTQGVSGTPVLTTSSADLDKLRAGLQLQLNVQTGPGSNLEFVYFGLNEWDETATAVSATPSLFSFFSRFGTRPPAGTTTPAGFDDSDRSFLHSYSIDSDLNNAEINFRRRWAEPYGFWQGSFLGGFRYFDLDEAAVFSARGENNDTGASNGLRFFDYSVRTSNNLAGFQLGGDLWYNLLPGVKLGGELKGGIFNNDFGYKGRISSNSLPGAAGLVFLEQADDNRTAYLVQASTQLYYRLSYSWAFRSSYQVLYVDSLGLAGNNFNGEPPALFLPGSARTVQINNKTDVVYQGVTVGAEYTW